MFYSQQKTENNFAIELDTNSYLKLWICGIYTISKLFLDKY